MGCGERDCTKKLWSFVSIVVPSKKCIYGSFLLLDKKLALIFEKNQYKNHNSDNKMIILMIIVMIIIITRINMAIVV